MIPKIVFGLVLLVGICQSSYIGSVIYRCHKDILYTPDHQKTLPQLIPELFDSQGRTNLVWLRYSEAPKTCAQNSDEILRICKNVYGENRIKAVVQGPSNFPLDHKDAGFSELVRPYLCLSDISLNIDLKKALDQKDSSCKMSTLLSSVMFQNENATFIQSSWESYAKLACSASDPTTRPKTNSVNPNMQLYQVNLIKPDVETFNSQQKMTWSGIEFICCPHVNEADVDDNVSADPLAKTIQLIESFNFNPPVIARRLTMEQPTGPVIGSFVVKCREFFAYTPVEAQQAVIPLSQDKVPNHWIHLGKESMEKAVNICPLPDKLDKSGQLLLKTCQEVYHGHEVTDAKFGPAMIEYIDPSLGVTHKLRPVWCMAKTSISLALPTLAECPVVRDLNPIQGADTTCNGQFELEKKAKASCELEKMKLYAAYPRKPCSQTGDDFESLHFICCPETAFGFNELSQGLQSKAEELQDSTNSQLLLNEVKEAFEEMQKSEERRTEDALLKLDQKLVFDAAELESVAASDKDLARSIADHAMQNALDDMMAVWLDHETKWSEQESREHTEISNRLDKLETSREQKLEELAKQKSTSFDALQHGLAEVLSALNSEVVELLRDLEAIKSQQPWRFMPIQWGVSYINGPAANLRVQDGQPPVWLYKVQSNLLRYVEKAKNRIVEFNKINWDRKAKSEPEAYSEEVTATYNQLQESIKNAKTMLLVLNDLALKNHGPYMDQPAKSGEPLVDVPSAVQDPDSVDAKPVLTNGGYKIEVEEKIYDKHVKEWDLTRDHLKHLLDPYTTLLSARLPVYKEEEGDRLNAPVRPTVHIIDQDPNDGGGYHPFLMFNEMKETPTHKKVSWSEALPKILITAVLVLIPVLLLLFVAILVVRVLAFRRNPHLRQHKRFATLLGTPSTASSLDGSTPASKQKESARNKLISRVQSRKLGFGTGSAQYQLVAEEQVLEPVSDLNYSQTAAVADTGMESANKQLTGYENPSFLA